MDSPLPPNQVDAVIELLRDVAPLEADIVGPAHLRHIASNGEISEVSGGRHLDLFDTLSLLASLATLAQVTVASRQWLLSRMRRKTDHASPSTIDAVDIRAHVIESLEKQGLSSSVREQLDRLDDLIESLKKHSE